MPEADTLATIARARTKADGLRAELDAVMATIADDAPYSSIMRGLRRMEDIRRQLELTGQ